jgi:hypothetical protein
MNKKIVPNNNTVLFFSKRFNQSLPKNFFAKKARELGELSALAIKSVLSHCNNSC